MTGRPLRVRSLALGSAVGLILALALAASPATASPSPSAPIEAPVLAAMQRTGKSVYWVVLKARADLRSAQGMSWKARGQFVADSLRATADQTQAELRSMLRTRGAEFSPFWGANVIRVTSDAATLDAVARRPEVERIEADRTYHIVDDIPAIRAAVVQSIEWNITNIRADQVWSTFSDRGEGVVVASIDTGVQYNHPALVNQYRGNLGGGNFNHNYNWYDPSLVCGNPSVVPCDNNNHGTHTMGTIVGDDGAGNEIGVAPGARWITAKGCESSSCSTNALVLSGQWMLAPTDLSGANPRSDLRPNVISNSWGSTNGSDTFYQQVVQNWVAAGIVPVFANGNSGPPCNTVGSPGSYPESIGVGAYDINNAIASFSSRGSSPFGGITKPNISAPGVNVRSSIPTNSYASFSGTSMATPHVTGVVALMLSAAPALVGDVAQVRSILDQTAIDTSDLTCGGTSANNNVFGQGRLDAYEAVNQSPRGPSGVVHGTVTDAVTHASLAGLQVHAVGPSDRTTTTNGSGAYSLTLPVGTYSETASGFGYLSQSASGLSVTNGGNLTQDFALTPAPTHSLSGHVREGNNNPIAGAKVTIQSTPLAPATSDVNGAYSFPAVPEGSYSVKTTAGRCLGTQTQSVNLTADTTLDFLLGAKRDLFGYTCSELAAAWTTASTPQALTGDDNYLLVSLPFSFPFYGVSYSSAYLTTNGYISFNTAGSVYSNTTIPSPSSPNAAVYPFWDDMWMDGASTINTATVGVAPNRQFVVEWDNVGFFANTAARVDFEVLLSENGDILTQYRNISASDGMEQGNSATLGIENANGSDGLQYSSGEAVVHDGLAVRYSLTTFTGVTGTVTDANDGLPIQGATVSALQGGNPVASTTTAAGGGYQLQLPAGSYSIQASMTNYATQSTPVTVNQGQGSTQNFALATGRLVVSPGSLSFSLAPGQQKSLALSVSNTGTASLTWSLVETADITWLSEDSTGGPLAAGGSQNVQVTADATGLSPATYTAHLQFSSNAAKQSTAQVSVTATVAPYEVRINTGGPAVSDSLSRLWSGDQAWVSGSWGYVGGSIFSTAKTITSTTDQGLYRDQRLNLSEYRFDNLPAGTYRIELRFAELKNVKTGARVFDVKIEGTTVLASFDILAKTGGTLRADAEVFTIVFGGGQLNIQFVAHAHLQPPVVNALWVLQQ